MHSLAKTTQFDSVFIIIIIIITKIYVAHILQSQFNIESEAYCTFANLKGQLIEGYPELVCF